MTETTTKTEAPTVITKTVEHTVTSNYLGLTEPQSNTFVNGTLIIVLGLALWFAYRWARKATSNIPHIR